MSDFGISNNPLLKGLAASEKLNQEDDSKELGQDAFLQLMIAQLKHQDPLAPQENGEFIAQLAQFSSVEGITKLGQSVEGLVNEFRSSRALEASALVGSLVEVDTNVAPLNSNGRMQGSVILPASTEQLSVTVSTPLGEVIRVEQLPSQAAGEIPFAWDGTNASGQPMPPGNYRVTANAILGGESTEIPVRLAANVNSVSLGNGNSITLNVDGVGEISIDDVRKFF